MESMVVENPKLRLIDAHQVVYEGEAYISLHDPLMLTERSLIVPQPLIPLLTLCDGTRTTAGLRASLAIRYGIFITSERVREFIGALDDALLLENQRSRLARAAAEIEFRQADFRTPSSAGLSYPSDADELTKILDQFYNLEIKGTDNGICGLVSPHIDFERGGPVYASVWASAAQAAQNADLAIVFGTDHHSEGMPFSLTRQNYATPFGILPTDTAIVDELADVIGIEDAYAGELHHRGEHSIELAAVWLHHVRGRKPIPLVPVLMGPLDTALAKESGRTLNAVLEVLSHALQTHRTLVIAAGDLAHVGPAFDTGPVDQAKLIQLKSADDTLINAICRGDPEEFNNAIKQVGDANQVCGVSPIYMTLRLLSPVRGDAKGYAVCPADEKQSSVVTICGVTLRSV